LDVEADLKNKQAGFSFFEPLIVVAIVLLIAVVTHPSLVGSRPAANESSAIASLRTLNSAAISYFTTYGSFPLALSNLGPAAPTTSNVTSADLIDSALASGAKNGYTFTWLPAHPDASGNIDKYTITAQPTAPGTTGQRSFYTDQSRVIRANVNGSADVNSTPLS
jgi:type IV pilus assembly protein PilA